VADAGYIAAGYLISLGALGAYAARLFARARRARARVAALSARSEGSGRAARVPSA
jgi:hypothetical protein